MHLNKKNTSILNLLFLYRENVSRLMDLPYCLCVCVSRHQLLNAWANIYDVWYVYQHIWAHFNGVLHKSLL
jgi:hypothetical protein